ncbi:hypothetical protein, partial [Escherichia coli]|uniref:hypothetical protein n=1 Tax=Escherichia coli TaxID=562 RepID=UPI0019D00E75
KRTVRALQANNIVLASVFFPDDPPGFGDGAGWLIQSDLHLGTLCRQHNAAFLILCSCVPGFIFFPRTVIKS